MKRRFCSSRARCSQRLQHLNRTRPVRQHLHTSTAAKTAPFIKTVIVNMLNAGATRAEGHKVLWYQGSSGLSCDCPLLPSAQGSPPPSALTSTPAASAGSHSAGDNANVLQNGWNTQHGALESVSAIEQGKHTSVQTQAGGTHSLWRSSPILTESRCSCLITSSN